MWCAVIFSNDWVKLITRYVFPPNLSEYLSSVLEIYKRYL